MIYTVTFNPAIDYLMHIKSITPGETNRSEYEHISFGGKGINVSFILNELNVLSTALGFIGGFTGHALKDGLNKKGIATDFVEIQGDTRINIKLKSNEETEINANGPDISESELNQLLEKLNKLESKDVLILSGSVPKTLPNDIYEVILSRLQGKDIHTVVDATGKLLLNTLKYKPLLIKPNKTELEDLFDYSINCEEDIVNGAKRLQEMGAKNVLVSLGKDGALLLDENGSIHKSPSLCKKAINTVGAGDSMIAGFIAGLNKGYEFAFKLANAAGGATAGLEDLANKEEIHRLMRLQD